MGAAATEWSDSAGKQAEDPRGLISAPPERPRPLSHGGSNDGTGGEFGGAPGGADPTESAATGRGGEWKKSDERGLGEEGGFGDWFGDLPGEGAVRVGVDGAVEVPELLHLAD